MLETAINDSSALLGKLPVWLGDVSVSVSIRVATIKWTCTDPSAANIQKYQRALEKLAPQFRYEITQKVRMKYSPELRFVFDDGTRERTRIETDMVITALERIVEHDREMDPVPLDDDVVYRPRHHD
jgi:ribosome-binding factor A